MRNAFYLGCAGWSLSRQQQVHFPAEGTHLERYAQILTAVEINSSFYRPHRPDTYARWRDSVPEHFRFSVKMPREITHMRGLRECRTLVSAFLAEAGRLEEKLGCLLVQLPPRLAYDEPMAKSFFADLRLSTHASIACEPRHQTWFSTEAADLLSAFDIARVEADPSPVKRVEKELETSVAYLRLHGSPKMYYSAYSMDFIDRLATRVKELGKGKRAVWCVFDNTAEGAALPDALSLQRRLNGC